MSVDIGWAIFMMLGLYIGHQRGLIGSIVYFFALFIGIMVGIWWNPVLSLWLQSHLGGDIRLYPLFSFLLIFLACIGLMKLTIYLLETIASAIYLGYANRLAGGLLWCFGLSIFYSTILWIFTELHWISPGNIHQSITYPYLHDLAPFIYEHAGLILPPLKTMFESLRHLIQEGIETLPKAL